eukprot:39574_1
MKVSSLRLSGGNQLLNVPRLSGAGQRLGGAGQRLSGGGQRLSEGEPPVDVPRLSDIAQSNVSTQTVSTHTGSTQTGSTKTDIPDIAQLLSSVADQIGYKLVA